MNISLEQLTQILVKLWISSSQEEEILTTIKDLTTPPETNKEYTFEESCRLDGEQLFEHEI